MATVQTGDEFPVTPTELHKRNSDKSVVVGFNCRTVFAFPFFFNFTQGDVEVPGNLYLDRRTIHSVLHLCKSVYAADKKQTNPAQKRERQPRGVRGRRSASIRSESLISLLGLSRGMRLLQRTMATISIVS